jgi:hypothetical protein
MTLNKLTGEIIINDFMISTDTTSLELNILNSKYEIKLRTTSTGSEFYSIPNIEDGDTSIQFLFYNDKLQRVNIGAGENYKFPAFVITAEEKSVVKKKLESIGGEKNYSWGSIEFSEDVKAGFVSILIKYKQGGNQ